MSFFDKLKQGLHKTKIAFGFTKVDDNLLEELEEQLIMADVGVNTVMELIDKLKKRVNDDKISDPNELQEVIIDEMFIIYVNDEILTNKINYNEKDISVILFVGVNGVGKTTTIATDATTLSKIPITELVTSPRPSNNKSHGIRFLIRSALTGFRPESSIVSVVANGAIWR